MRLPSDSLPQKLQRLLGLASQRYTAFLDAHRPVQSQKSQAPKPKDPNPEASSATACVKPTPSAEALGRATTPPPPEQRDALRRSSRRLFPEAAAVSTIPAIKASSQASPAPAPAAKRHRRPGQPRAQSADAAPPTRTSNASVARAAAPLRKTTSAVVAHVVEPRPALKALLSACQGASFEEAARGMRYGPGGACAWNYS